MIDVKNLTKWYGRVLAVDNISFHVEQGEIVGFLGPNGAGKSTTLKILTCFFPASSGTASVAGHDVLSESLEVRRSVGYMPENVPIYPEMRVREFLMFRAALRDIPRKNRRLTVDRIAERCWLSQPEDMMRRRLGELSRGYKQRVGLADVLLHEPPVLILDEPTIGLDPAQIRSMRQLITDLADQHTVILSSHILAEVEQTCSKLIIIAAGRIAATGTPSELRNRVIGPARIIAEMRGADQKQLTDAVKTVKGVREVNTEERDHWVRLVISHEPSSDLRVELAKLAAERNFELRELRREVGSLEDFFIQITYEQNLHASDRLAGTG